MRESRLLLSPETSDLRLLKRELRTVKIIECVDLNNEAQAVSVMGQKLFECCMGAFSTEAQPFERKARNFVAFFRRPRK
jgi:hypothetical protein